MRWWLAAVLPPLLYLAVLAATGGIGSPAHGPTDDYNLLVHGLASGHLYLDAPVAPGLLRLANPYDPAARAGIPYLHDASLYAGHYYLYFGITPAATLLLPFHWLTGRDLPVGDAVWLFVSAEYLLLLALLRLLVRRHYPAASLATIALGAAGLATAGAELTLLARHSMYELAIASGAAFFLGALYALFVAESSPRPARWAAAAGLCVGLAAGGRPFYALGAILLLAPLLRPHSSARWRRVGAGLGVCAAVGALLALYNLARFGHAAEFGQSYQLSASVEAQVRHFSLRYLPIHAFMYLLAPLRWSRYFPFLHPAWVPPPPAGFPGVEWAYGLFVNAPFTLFALPGAVAAFRRGGAWEARVIAGCAAATFGILACFWGCVARYLGDFAPLWSLLAAFGLVAFSRRWVLACAGAAVAASTLVALLLACILYDNFWRSSPEAYAALARIANTPVGWAEALARTPRGPVELTLTLAPPGGPPQPIVSAGPGNATDGVWLQRPDAGHVVFWFHHGSFDIAHSPLIAVHGPGPYDAGVSFGSLYPPPEHPYFFGVPAARVAGMVHGIHVRWQGRPVWSALGEFYPPAPGTVRTGRDADSPAARYAGRILAVRRTPPWWTDAPAPSRALEISLLLADLAPGRCLPLATTGAANAGDAVFVQITGSASVRFGYDHGTDAPIWSRLLPWDRDDSQTLRVVLPAAPGDRLEISSAGSVLWNPAVPVYPHRPDQVYPGTNVIGSGACEIRLPDGCNVLR